MLIKEAEYKEVEVIQRRQISPAVYGCDECECEIENYPNENNRLEVTVFFNDHEKDTENLHFCSWDCVLSHLPKIKTDYFVSLPHLIYDVPKENKKGAYHLMKLLSK